MYRATASLAIAAELVVMFVWPASAQVVIDVDVKHQVMQRFGASNRLWNDPHLSRSATIDISVSGVAAVGRVQGTRTSPTEQWWDLPGIVVPGTRFGAMLPPNSVTTLVLTASE